MRFVDPRLVVVCLSLFAGSSCTGFSKDPVAEEARLMETSRQWSSAAQSGNIDAIVAYWSDDAAVMMSGLPTFRGKKAIREYVAQSMRVPGFAIRWEPLEAHVSASGDMGYILERSFVTFADPAGKSQTQQLRAVSVWRKQADGKWRNVVDVSNSQADLAH